jgi:DNA adenine methylase
MFHEIAQVPEIITKPTKTELQPLFKYMGGKRGKVSHFAHILTKCKVYIEPFCGGASVFCHMYNSNKAERYILNDTISHVVNIYKSVKEDPHRFIQSYRDIVERWNSLPPVVTQDGVVYLTRSDYSGDDDRRSSKVLYRDISDSAFDRKDYYYYLRAAYQGNSDPATFCLILNACFDGGVQFQNKDIAGAFTQGVGNPFREYACDENNILAWHEALQITDIYNFDYRDIPLPNDDDVLIYCDPPYRNVFMDYDQ